MYIIKRILSMFFMIIIISIIIFFIIKLIPGDPIQIMFGDSPDQIQIQKIRDLYGLDQPFIKQYFIWFGNLVKGDWGTSIILGKPVLSLIMERLPRTAILATLSIIISSILGIVFAVISAAKNNSLLDLGISTLSFVSLSMPQFWFGILLILFFGVTLRILPTSGYVDPSQGIMDSIKTLILPVAALVASQTAVIVRIQRSSLLDCLNQDYITLARSKGCSEPRVLYIHALRNSLIPTATIIGMRIGYLLGGVVVIERVFAFPGMGTLLISSLFQRDYPIIQGVMLVFSSIVVFVNFITDFLYKVIDPRIRYN